EVTTHRDGERFMQRFTNGGQPASDLELIGASKEMGTIIHFKPDPEIFSMTEFKFDTIQERLREAAFLFPDLKITLTDERTDTTVVYQYDDLLLSLVNYLNDRKDFLHDVLSFSGTQEYIEMYFAFQFTESYSENIYSCVNHL